MDIELLRKSVQDQMAGAMLALLPQYMESVYVDGDIEDMRKALALGLEVTGMRNREKVENLPTVNISFNGMGGATMTVDVKPPEPAKPEPVVIDAPVQDVQDQAQEAPVQSTATIDAINAGLDAFFAKALSDD